MRSIDIAVAAVFAAFAIAIPIFFRGPLQIVIPAIGYSATLASHVPIMLSIMFGPLVTAIVGAVSTVGFIGTLGPVVGARAATHIIWGVAAAFAVKKGMSFPKALFLVALPLHASLEGLVVIPFGILWQGALVTVAGTAIQHIIDSIISILVLKAALPLIKTLRSKRKKKEVGTKPVYLGKSKLKIRNNYPLFYHYNFKFWLGNKRIFKGTLKYIFDLFYNIFN